MGNDLDGAGEEDPGVFWVLLELDRLLPQLDRSGDVLERCAIVSSGTEDYDDLPFLRTRFLALVSVSSSTARIQILTDCGSSCTALARITFAFSLVCGASAAAQLAEVRTFSSEAAIQTSSFLAQCSQPSAMILRAATTLPATFSSQAAATQPGACLGFVLMRDWRSARARLMSLRQSQWSPARIML